MRTFSFFALSVTIISTAVVPHLVAGGVLEDQINRGHDLYDKGEYSKAIVEYDEALRIMPDVQGESLWDVRLILNRNAEVYFGRAMAWLAKSDYNRAIADFDKAHGFLEQASETFRKESEAGGPVPFGEVDPRRRTPRGVHVHLNRGLAYYDKGDYDEAITDYDKAFHEGDVAGRPVLLWENADVHRHRGDAWQAKKDYDMALADYDKAIANYAQAGLQRKEYEESPRLRRDKAAVYTARANVWVEKGQYDRAIADCMEALRVDPKHIAAYDCLAVVEIKKLKGKFLGKGYRSTWSADGNCVAYCKYLAGETGPSGGGVAVFEIATGKTTQLTDVGKDPAWSPTKGGPIAYAIGGLPDTQEVWLVESNGDNPRKIAEGLFPSWSSDGQTLFYVSPRTRPSALMAMELQANGQFGPSHEVCRVASYYPAVSPDGKNVVYRSGKQLVVAPFDSSRPVRKWPLPGGTGLFAGWTPDGKRLGLGGWGVSDTLDFWVLDLETDRAVRIASAPFTMPAWAPDGSKLALDLRLRGGFEVWMLDTGELPQLQQLWTVGPETAGGGIETWPHTESSTEADTAVKQRQADVGGQHTTGRQVLTNSIGVQLALISAGEFLMGSPETPEELARGFAASEAEPEDFDDERPPHRVRITKPFYLGVHEVTVGQFRKFVEEERYQTEAERDGKGGDGYNASKNELGQKPEYTWRNPGFPQTDDHPVVQVSWNDAVAFCEWLSRKEGTSYRLPTEAEWEYACRARTTTRYYHGDDDEGLAQVGNVADATGKAKFPDWFAIRATDGYVLTAPVGQFQPNQFGLYDMHGNVWEWCADWYDEQYYARSPSEDPPGATSGSDRVLRGGGWFDRAWACRAAYRSWNVPSDRDVDLGFRVAMTVPFPQTGTASSQKKAGSPQSQDRPTPKPSVSSTPPTAAKPVPPWTLPPGAPPPAVAPFNAAKAKEHQAAWAKFLGVQVEMTNSIGMRFVLIPPGEFDMGSTEEEVAKLLEQARATNQPSWCIDRLPSEAPKHRVRITKPFWLGVYEVTRGQFRRFVDERGYKTEAERDGKGGYGWVDGQWKQDPRFVWNRDLGFEQTDEHPVVNVTWNDVTAFCTWLSEKEGEKTHLPSEAQWEYACRAGTTTTWYSGDDEGALKEHGWFSFNSDKKTHPVAQKTPNAWGLYDMHGNAWEWCQDWWGDRYYATSPLDDPPGATGGSRRVGRGGCWFIVASDGRASSRGGEDPGRRGEILGYRLARIVSSPSR